MTGSGERGEAPKRLRRRANVIAAVAMVAIAVGLTTVVVLAEGTRPGPATWVIVGIGAMVVVAGLALAVRSRTADDHVVLDRAERPMMERPTVDEPGPEPDLDLTAGEVDPLAPIPDDEAVLAADVSEIDLTRHPVVRVVLHPGPITRRRLNGRSDALVVVADGADLDVPGWIVEGRSRTIDRADRVLIPWASIERFRVRAESNGPGFYEITARPDAGPPRRWRVRRDEIADELALLDHIRRIGRVTIELEDSIRS